jgi:protein gp37
MTTKIQWTNETINPIVGCSRISEGCQNCYAATAAKSARLQQFNQYKLVGNWDGSVQFVESQLLKPLSWKQPKQIFVCSMADIFHKNVPDEWIDKVLAVATLCPHHTFQILTKRPSRMLTYFSNPDRLTAINFQISEILKEPFEIYQSRLLKLPLPNVWLGVSVENQLAADTRIKFLTQTPAAVRFLSCEPLLERLNLSKWVFDRSEADSITNYPVDWVIVGGESGLGSRPCHLNWIKSIVDQCYQGNIPVFVKQLGSNAIDSVTYADGVALAHHQIKTSDSKGSDISQFPGINIRQFPA